MTKTTTQTDDNDEVKKSTAKLKRNQRQSEKEIGGGVQNRRWQAAVQRMLRSD